MSNNVATAGSSGTVGLSGLAGLGRGPGHDGFAADLTKSNNVATSDLSGSAWLSGPSALSSDLSHDDHAADLIRAATDPSTGWVDTERLAHWVVGARQSNPAVAGPAFEAIERQLARHSYVDAGNFGRDVDTVAKEQAGWDYQGPWPSGQWAAGQRLVSQADPELITCPRLEKRWEFTKSAWTGRGGPPLP